MLIKGLQKLTLLDFPEKIACTVFTGGCNFRCPFCHNAPLVIPERMDDFCIPEEEFFSFLATRTGILEGVCITGGEPTLMPDLPAFLARIKAMGFAVKLDTNGTRPAVLRILVEGGLVDYVAMDVKNSLAKYPETVGLASFDTSEVEESIAYLLTSPVPYEFRTTLVGGLHKSEDLVAIGRLIAGAERYFLQMFKDSGDLIGSCSGPVDPAEIEVAWDTLCTYVPNAQIRGE